MKYFTPSWCLCRSLLTRPTLLPAHPHPLPNAHSSQRQDSIADSDEGHTIKIDIQPHPALRLVNAATIKRSNQKSHVQTVHLIEIIIERPQSCSHCQHSICLNGIGLSEFEAETGDFPSDATIS